jgi:phenylpropionate dioxygenase-like ring-hydroxylating dioxygenase large terminal subunit
MDAHWYAVAQSKSLGKKPMRVELHGKAVVLFRGANGVSALQDMCPHRFALLSQGRVVNGDIECPYHGWRFAASGKCTAIPVHDGPLPKRFVPALAAKERHGLIFVCYDVNATSEPYAPTWDGQPFIRTILQNETVTSLVNLAENVLDPTHTLFVHKGLMRGLTSARSKVQISVSANDTRVDVRFDGEDKQNGILSLLLEGKRSRSTGSFQMPGIVELEYWSGDKLSLVTTLYFTGQQEHRQLGFAVLTAPKNYGLGYLKKLLFVPVMRHIINQDRQAMDSAQANWEYFGKPMRAMSPTDFMRTNIEALIDGTRPPAADNPTTITYEL